MDRFAGLSEQERAACCIAERSLRVTAKAWDVNGRQGVADAMLTYSDGREAAFEVTSLAADGALHTDSLLARDNHRWPLPGRWFWSIRVGSPSDIPRLRAVYQKIILLCESEFVNQPRQVARHPNADSDIQWLVNESSAKMTGHPNVPARMDTGELRQAMVTPPARAAFVDTTLTNLAEALRTAWDGAKHIGPHFEKLERAQAAERHLFIALHFSALPASQLIELMSGNALPPSSPPTPDYLSHLWLAPQHSRRVLSWDRQHGWRNFHPYDDTTEV